MRKGIALIAVILIILVTSIAVLGVTVFISQALPLGAAGISREQAIFAAQSGVLAAIYDYRLAPGAPYWVKAQSINVAGNVFYTVGNDSNFLLVRAANPRIQSNTIIRNIGLQNINNTSRITVNRMRLWWDFGGNLNRIRLGNAVRWSGSATSGQLITLTSQCRFNARQQFAGIDNNTWRFTSTIPNNAIVVAEFYFTDNSVRKAYLLNNGRSGNNEFSIKSTGMVLLGWAKFWRRTIEATYDVTVGRITSWQETDSL